jgi:NAD(P)-dependent dehydrogenase (short-subunit alcohol dehydrogenase family)
VKALFDLGGQVVLVTGAARGLGLAIAQACAAQGAAVALVDLDEAALAAAVGALRGEGREVLPIVADLADPAAPTLVWRRALAWRGRIDTLVCNAGLGSAGIALDSDPGRRLFDVNLYSAVRLTDLAAPWMAEHGGGSIVLMSSIAGLRGNQALGLYALSKAALAQLARNLAVEWGPKNVRANAISPGLIRTPLSQGLLSDDRFMQRRLAATPLRRIGEPHEIAGVAVMLASAAGAFITGQNLMVDGGTLISDGS